MATIIQKKDFNLIQTSRSLAKTKQDMGYSTPQKNLKQRLDDKYNTLPDTAYRSLVMAAVAGGLMYMFDPRTSAMVFGLISFVVLLSHLKAGRTNISTLLTIAACAISVNYALQVG